MWSGFGQVPGITVADTVASQATLTNGSDGVYRLNANGQLDTVVEAPDARFREVPSGRVGLNASGSVAFPGETTAGPAGIYLWTNRDVTPIIETGAPLFGSRVTGVGLGVGDLNDRGQVLFQYDLADGRSGLAVATPGREPSPPVGVATVGVTVDTPKISRGAGQVATVTLSRAGGDLAAPLKIAYTLSGALVSGTDFATLPGTKKFKAGKATVSFQILPLPGGANGKVNVVLAPGAGYEVASPAKVKIAN